MNFLFIFRGTIAQIKQTPGKVFDINTYTKIKEIRMQVWIGMFQALYFKSVRYLRYRYWTKSRQMRSHWLIQTLKNSVKKGQYTYMNVDTGKRVCSVAFHLLYNINKNVLEKCKTCKKEFCCF